MFIQQNNSTNQYLGTCLKCKKFEALSHNEGLCRKCMIKEGKIK